MASANYIVVDGEYLSVNHPKAKKRLQMGNPALPNPDYSDFDAPDHIQTPPKRSKGRIRQSSKPLLNELEKEFSQHLRALRGSQIKTLYEQAITFRLCNGVKYTPDFVSIETRGRIQCYDVKGPQIIRDDASVKIKVAAAQYPELNWHLAWKDEFNGWRTQQILP